MTQIIASLFISGLLFGSGPCLASCGPLLVSFIAGTQKNIGKGLAAYAMFSLSRIFAYLILVLLIFFLGRFAMERFAGEYSRYISFAGGLFVIFVGIIMVLGKRGDFGLIAKAQGMIAGSGAESIVPFGLIVGFLPCAPLVGILSFIGLVSRDWFTAILYGLSFGLGTFISPLILMVVVAGLLPRLFSRNAALYRRLFNIACGLVVIFLGAQLIYRGVY